MGDVAKVLQRFKGSKDYYEQLYANKFHKLNEMSEFLERCERLTEGKKN